VKKYTVSLEEGGPFYAENESASDFIYSQDCPAGRYQEIYFSPDCVLLQVAERDIYWFDLGYTNVSWDESTGRRRHRYANHNLQRKFSFSFRRNRYSMLDFTNLYSRVSRLIEFTPQDSAEVVYTIGTQYTNVMQIDQNGTVIEATNWTLDKIWNAQRKVKIGLMMGHMTLIFPVRIAYRHGDVISFASKDVVIPEFDAREFSWDESHVGNICVSTDGSISIYRKNKPGSVLENLLPMVFPRLSRKLSALTELDSDNVVKKWISWVLKKNWRLLGKYIIPFKITHTQCRFSIFLENLKD